MLTELSTYKNLPAVVITTSTLRAVFLPEDGAKMASLISLAAQKELLLVKEGKTYRTLSYDGSYVQAECSAFDDMCPTIDPYTPQSGAYQGVTYPDHGEACRLSYTVTYTDSSVTFTAQSRLFALTYSKTVREGESGNLIVQYQIKNAGSEPFEFLWAGHIMLQGEDGMQIKTPYPDTAKTQMVFATAGYDRDALSRTALTGFLPEKGAAYKFYYTQKIPQGWFSAAYKNGDELFFSYDNQKIPYLGVWFNNGEFQNIYNVAPELCTLPFDAPHKAAERGYTAQSEPTAVIPANETYQFEIEISYRRKMI